MNNIKDIIKFASNIKGVTVRDWSFDGSVCIYVRDVELNEDYEEVSLEYDFDGVNTLIKMLPPMVSGYPGDSMHVVDGIDVYLTFASADI